MKPPNCAAYKTKSSKIIETTETEIEKETVLELNELKNASTIEINEEEEIEEGDLHNSTTQQERKKRDEIKSFQERKKRDEVANFRYNKVYQMEMDVATPEMLIFDRDEQNKIFKQQQNKRQQEDLNKILNKTNIALQKQQQEFQNFERFCFEKFQIFYSIPLIGLMLIFITFFCTITFYKKNFDTNNNENFKKSLLI